MNCKNKSFMTKKKAFTLIELLIVIAIIGILFIVLVSKVDFATDKAKATGVQTDFRSFQLAFDTVAKENAGFNTFGYNSGDNAGGVTTAGGAITLNGKAYTYTNALKDLGDGQRNSYDVGDDNLDGIQNGSEVWTGRKVYTETFTNIYTFVKPGTSVLDTTVLAKLETAINANLDPKLHITIADDGKITMANGAQDPWNNEYHGYYISKAAEQNGADRGAIVMYSDGANGVWGSAHDIDNSVVSVTVPNSNKDGKDDYSLVSVYTFVNGYGEVLNLTTGFSNNQSYLGSNKTNVDVIPGGGNTPGEETPDTPNTPEIPSEPEVVIAPGLYTSGQNYAPEALITPWQQLIDNGIMKIENGVVSCLQNLSIVGDLMLPHDGSITAIADNGFKTCTLMTDIKLPDGIITVGSYAFASTRLPTLTLPDSITDIGSYAFYLCRATSVHLPENLVNLGSYAFNASDVTEIVIPDKVTKIAEWTFYGSKLQSLTLGDSVVRIEQQAFDACSYLNTINFSDAGNLQQIGMQAFRGCSITSLDIPDGVLTIWNNSFSGCKKLKTVTMTDSVTGLFGSCFQECTALESIRLSDNITTIDQYDFYGCTKLTSINVPSQLKRISTSAFYGCVGLTSFVLPETMEEIGQKAFAGCTGLTEMIIPDATTRIQYNAFDGCTSLETVVLPNSNLMMRSDVFKNCTNLTNVTIKNISEITGTIFSGCTNLTSVTYNGTAAQWNAMMSNQYISNTWYEGSSIVAIHCTDTTIYL